MTFPAELERLLKEATPAPWMARPEYGCRDPEDWEVAPDRVCKFGVPSEIARVWNYEDKNEPNAELIALLRNHADAILGLVLAMESIANNTCCEGCQEAKRVAESALAKLKEGK